MTESIQNRPYWNAKMETLSRAELDRFEGPLIAEQLAYVYATSPFYRSKLDAARIQPDAITSRDALATVPFTEKAEVTNAQRAGALFGPHQCAPYEEIVRVVGTGGTSGQPTRIGWTQGDVGLYNEMGARALWTNGCRPGDFVVNCFNYSLYAGGVMDHMAFETLGAAILPYGVGHSERLLELLAALPINAIPGNCVLYATPSYALRLHRLAEERGLQVRQLGIRRGIFSGEPGLQLAGYRAKIEDAWGMTAMDLYGLAELGVQSGECSYRCGLHYGGDGLVVAELIDPATGSVKPMTSEAVGELVFTTLRRRACPLIRLRTHDMVRVHPEPCACGRTSFRFHVLGRSDDMFIVKGVNVFPLGVQEALMTFRPAVTGEFLIVLDREPPIDYAPLVFVELAASSAPDDLTALEQHIVATIRRHSNFTAAVRFVAAGTISSEHKTRRLYRAYAGEHPPALRTWDSDTTGSPS